MKKYLFIFFTLGIFAYAIVFPSYSGRVVDNANILSDSIESSLKVTLDTLEQTTTDQLVVVTLRSLEGNSIEEYGYQLGRYWGVGQKEKDNGVLLIIAPKEREVRIEVGYGLEGKLTDYTTHKIIQEDILPLLKQHKFDEAAEIGVKSIKNILHDNNRTQVDKTSISNTEIVPFHVNYKVLLLAAPFILIFLFMFYKMLGSNKIVFFFMLSMIGIFVTTIVLSQEYDFDPIKIIFGFFGVFFVAMVFSPLIKALFTNRKDIVVSIVFPMLIVLIILHMGLGYLNTFLSFVATVGVLIVVGISTEKVKPYKIIDKSMAIAFGVFFLDLVLTLHYLPALVFAIFAFVLSYWGDPKVFAKYSKGSNGSRRWGGGSSSSGSSSSGGGSFGGGGSSGNW